jgi:tRNA-2-methylthio-N6-dimethylallyladenosine synthase
MRRGYTAEEYRSLVQRAREILPGVSITTDLIAGFPGESEKDFQKTLQLMREVKFDDAFTFAYSHRPGTAAGEKKHQVPLDVRQRRLERFIALQREITHRLNQGIIGRTEEVLVESRSKRSLQDLSGRTRTNKVVNFPGNQKLIGRLVQVRIKRAQSGTAWGQRASGKKVEKTRRAEVKGNTIC